MHDAEKVYTESSFSIDTESESAGGERVGINGRADIGGVARELIPFAKDNGAVATLIGLDAIAAVVNNKNRVKNLTQKQLEGIFTGKIRNWKEVGGLIAPIRVLIVRKESATRDVFKKVILGNEDYKKAEVIYPDYRIMGVVAKDPNAIGQISYSFINNGKRKVRALRIDGQEISVDNPNYPISRPLYLVTKGEPKGKVKAFIDWVRSPEGQKVVKAKFVGIR